MTFGRGRTGATTRRSERAASTARVHSTRACFGSPLWSPGPRQGLPGTGSPRGRTRAPGSRCRSRPSGPWSLHSGRRPGCQVPGNVCVPGGLNVPGWGQCTCSTADVVRRPAQSVPIVPRSSPRSWPGVRRLRNHADTRRPCRRGSWTAFVGYAQLPVRASPDSPAARSRSGSSGDHPAPGWSAAAEAPAVRGCPGTPWSARAKVACVVGRGLRPCRGPRGGVRRMHPARRPARARRP
jgi:hypothetical protein